MDTDTCLTIGQLNLQNLRKHAPIANAHHGDIQPGPPSRAGTLQHARICKGFRHELKVCGNKPDGSLPKVILSKKAQYVLELVALRAENVT